MKIFERKKQLKTCHHVEPQKYISDNSKKTMFKSKFKICVVCHNLFIVLWKKTFFVLDEFTYKKCCDHNILYLFTHKIDYSKRNTIKMWENTVWEFFYSLSFIVATENLKLVSARRLKFPIPLNVPLRPPHF